MTHRLRPGKATDVFRTPQLLRDSAFPKAEHHISFCCINYKKRGQSSTFFKKNITLIKKVLILKQQKMQTIFQKLQKIYEEN